ncbi:MAG: hypothetical protein WCH32_11590 [Pseudomonadota bacterium]
MSEKPDPDDYEDDEIADGDSLQFDRLIRDVDARKPRAGPKGAEPAWRRLEKYLEGKRTAELLADVDDYEIDDAPPRAAPVRPARPKRSRR